MTGSGAQNISSTITNTAFHVSLCLAASKPLMPTTQPRFLSRGHTYRAVVGDTLVLPCEVENLGTHSMSIYEVRRIIL